MRYLTTVITLCIGSAVCGAQSAVAPDVVLLGGKVFTADSMHPWAEAIAIRGERVVAVGTSAEIRRLARPATRVIDVGGRVVVPGINDAHDHVGDVPLGAEFRTSPSPTPDPTAAQVLDSLRHIAARTPAGTWLKTNIGLTVLNDTTARRAALDGVAPGHPVILWTWWGHGTVLNSAALRALGIADSARDPLGGWYERDASGHVTGRLDEYAEWGALMRLYSTLPESALVAGLRAFADSSLRMGVTTVQNMAGYGAPALTVRAFRTAELPIRVRLIRWPTPNGTGRNEGEWDAVEVHPAARLTVSGRKWVLDGTPIERNALQRHAYPGRSDWHGRLDFPLDTVRAMLAECAPAWSGAAASAHRRGQHATARTRPDGIARAGLGLAVEAGALRARTRTRRPRRPTRPSTRHRDRATTCWCAAAYVA